MKATQYQIKVLTKQYAGRMWTKRLRKKLFSRPDYYFRCKANDYTKLLEWYFDGGERLREEVRKHSLLMPRRGDGWKGSYIIPYENIKTCND